MNKIYKKSKSIKERILCLSFVCLLSLNSFAVVVNENDSSSFVTKAEFEALKNDIVNQVDNYNEQIDKKIEGAIATYLAEKEEKAYDQLIYNSDWDEVYEINGVLVNDSRLPNFDSVFTYFHNKILYGSNEYSALDIVELVASYKNENTYNLQNICRNSEPSSSTSDVIWKGRALNYSESIVTRAVTKGTDGHSGWSIDNADNGYKLGNITAIKNSGVYTGTNKISNTNIFTDFQVQWVPSNNSNFQILSKTYESSNLLCEINLKNVDGNSLSHEHILNFQNQNNWELADNTQAYALYVPQTGANTTKTLADSSTKRTNQALGHIYHTRVTEEYKCPVDRRVVVTPNTWTGQSASSYTTRYVPRLGCVNGYRASNKILQYGTDQIIETTNKVFNIGNPNILNGFVLCAQNEDKEYKWEPIFDFISYDGSTTVPTNYEIDIYLSKEPFSGDWTSIDSSKLIKHIENGTTLNHWTTTDKKIEMSWVADATSVIYCIWCPSLKNCSETDIKNKDWQIRIDLKNCNSLKVK